MKKFKLFEYENGELEAVTKMERPLVTFKPDGCGGGVVETYYDDDDLFAEHPAPVHTLNLSARGVAALYNLLFHATEA